MNIQSLLSVQNLLRHTRFHSNRKVSLEEQIAYIASYYPTPMFVKMDFDEANKENTQEKPPKEMTEKPSKLQEDKPTVDRKIFAPSVSWKEKMEYPVSEIEGESVANLFNTKQTVQGKDKKSLCGSEYAYKQLLAEMNSQDMVIQKFPSSAKKQPRQRMHFFGSQKKSIGDEIKENPRSIGNRNLFRQKEVQKSPKKKELIDCKWDSAAEIQFRRKNKLKWFEHIIYLRYMKNLQDSWNKIEIQAFTQPCPKCEKSMRKNDNQTVCKQCQKPKICIGRLVRSIRCDPKKTINTKL